MTNTTPSRLSQLITGTDESDATRAGRRIYEAATGGRNGEALPGRDQEANRTAAFLGARTAAHDAVQAAERRLITYPNLATEPTEQSRLHHHRAAALLLDLVVAGAGPFGTPGFAGLLLNSAHSVRREVTDSEDGGRPTLAIYRVFTDAGRPVPAPEDVHRLARTVLAATAVLLPEGQTP